MGIQGLGSCSFPPTILETKKKLLCLVFFVILTLFYWLYWLKITVNQLSELKFSFLFYLFAGHVTIHWFLIFNILDSSSGEYKCQYR